MRKSVLMLCCLAFAGAASALTVDWNWTPNGSDWNVEESSYYMVYSGEKLSAEQVVAAAANANKTTYNGIGTTWGSNLNTSEMAAPEGAVVSGAAADAFFGDGSTVWASFGDDDFPVASGETSGYLYLVVFEDGDISSANQFAVATAGQTGYVQIDNDGMTVDGATPDAGAFVLPVFFGGTSKAAPEPTALALLALGIAGVALRRRVR